MPFVDPIHGYTLTFEERPGYLHALVEGEKDSYEISRSFWIRVAGRVAETGAARVMIEENIVEGMLFADVFQLASEIPELGFGRTRIAFVDPHIDQKDVNTFGELVAQNRGVNGKVFTDAASGELWLVRDVARLRGTTST